LDQDVIYEHFAKRKFPLHLLDVSLYESSSWKTLVKDDNAKNGYYRLQLNAVSYGLCNSEEDDVFYVNMIRSIAWDKKEKQIILEVEAFGEDDMSEASSASIYRIVRTTRGVILHPVDRDHRIWCEDYENNGVGFRYLSDLAPSLATSSMIVSSLKSLIRSIQSRS
jgi:hypothetical protein